MKIRATAILFEKGCKNLHQEFEHPNAELVSLDRPWLSTLCQPDVAVLSTVAGASLILGPILLMYNYKYAFSTLPCPVQQRTTRLDPVYGL